jgi:hypothetical protein
MFRVLGSSLEGMQFLGLLLIFMDVVASRRTLPPALVAYKEAPYQFILPENQYDK